MTASDSCLTGCGSFSENTFFHTVFPEFILKQNLHINYLELLAIMVTVKLWGKYWKGKKIVLYTDNQNSCRALNSGILRNSFMQSCLREICFHAANSGILIGSLIICQGGTIAQNIQSYSIPQCKSECKFDRILCNRKQLSFHLWLVVVRVQCFRVIIPVYFIDYGF